MPSLPDVGKPVPRDSVCLPSTRFSPAPDPRVWLPGPGSAIPDHAVASSKAVRFAALASWTTCGREPAAPSTRGCMPVSLGGWAGARRPGLPNAKASAGAGPRRAKRAALIQVRPDSAVQRPDRLSCWTMASRGAAAAPSAHYVRLRSWIFVRRARGTFVGRRAE